jgi:cytosine/adenosine deaminase-related metal-dependent hydrolase
MGPEQDPIRSLVHYAVSEDVEHVFIDGRQVISAGQIVGLDERETLRAASSR